MLKKCVICGAEFSVPPSNGTVTCSKKCSSERRRRQRLAAPLKRVTKKCVVCGAEFSVAPSMSASFSTCSPECRAEYSRRRMIERRAPDKIWRTCAVCGRMFYSPPSATVTTCRRRECTGAARSASATSRLKTHLPEMQAGLAKSPICQRDERHHNAKNWCLSSPEGKCYEFRNLRHFVRTNSELFTADELKPVGKIPRAAVYLGRLRPSLSKPRACWHGWTWKTEQQK